MRILITSVGRRGYLVKYFKEAIKGQGEIFVADCSDLAPAFYRADKYFLLPPISSRSYFLELTKICKENKINGLVSLNDLELPVISKNKDKLKKLGVEAIVPKLKTVEICYDKYKTYLFFKQNDFPTPKTFINLRECLAAIKRNEITFPLIIKQRKGSASAGIVIVNSAKEAKSEFAKSKDLIIQELIGGQEYGVDIFCNASHELISIFIKKKIKMRAGETDKAVSVYDSRLIDMIKKVVKKIDFYGPIDIDIFKHGNRYSIIEINPRFGGGYPLAHALKADFPGKIVKLINQERVKSDFLRYPNNIFMMKQDEIIIRR